MESPKFDPNLDKVPVIPPATTLPKMKEGSTFEKLDRKEKVEFMGLV